MTVFSQIGIDFQQQIMSNFLHDGKTHTHIYIYIYIERERQRDRERQGQRQRETERERDDAWLEVMYEIPHTITMSKFQ